MRMRLTGTGALRRLGVGALTMAFAIGLAGMEPAQAGGTLRVAMSASDVPLPKSADCQKHEKISQRTKLLSSRMIPPIIAPNTFRMKSLKSR